MNSENAKTKKLEVRRVQQSAPVTFENPHIIKNVQDMIGRTYLFRAVTYHQVGMVAAIIDGKFLHLTNASWVADSGRFAEALRTGKLKESEYTGDHFLNLDTVVDFFPWRHDLPEPETKSS